MLHSLGLGFMTGARGGEARGRGGGRGDEPPADRDGGEARGGGEARRRGRGRGRDRSHRRRDGGTRGVPSGGFGGVLVRAGAPSETFCGDAQTPSAHARGDSRDRGGATLPTGGGVATATREERRSGAWEATTIRRLGSAPRVTTRAEERGGFEGMPSNERRDSGNEHASVGGASARSPRVDVRHPPRCSRADAAE